MQDLKFPIGEFAFKNDGNLEEWISNIKNFPSKLNKITLGLTQEQINLKYRPEGWSIKQVVHHCADSHMNSFIRFKLALTEKDAVIRPYFEDRWAELSDSLDDDTSDSIALITALHSKWTKFLRMLEPKDLKIEFVHPEHGTRVSLLENIAFYSWHCEHHFAHIEQALQSKGQYN
jgi:hypothetical protein